MLTTSWTCQAPPADPAAGCTMVAVRLRLRFWRGLPRLAGWLLQVRRQLRGADGLLGYAFAFEPSGPAFWAVSAWSRRGCLARFEAGGAHRAAKEALRGVLLPPVLAVWDCPASELPPAWDEVARRVGAGAAAR